MPAPSASMAALKLLNLRTPAIQNLIRRRLLHPTAAAAAAHLLKPTSRSLTLPDAQSLNLAHPQNGITKHELNARNSGIHASNLHLYLQFPSGLRGLRAYRTYATRHSKDDPDEDYDDDDDDDDDEDDDGEIQDYSGSDFDDDDDDYDDSYDDADEDSDARPRSGRYRN